MSASRRFRLLALALSMITALTLGEFASPDAPGAVVTHAAAATRVSPPPDPKPSHQPKKASEPPARTTAREARRVDRVRTPKLRWYRCAPGVQCATAKLPMDYDHPHGRQVEVALSRVRAGDQRHRIGTLFVNPGGPGGSGTDLAAHAREFLSPAVVKRFDVVGVDPRGTNSSAQVHCFSSPRTQLPVLDTLDSVAFPYGRSQERRYVKAAEKLGRACSRQGKPLSASMSTAEVARDMDVLRRAVGDRKLNYLGFSYGTFLGEVYANLFPDRIRTMAIDGVIDPQGWVGSSRTRSKPLDERIHTAEGSWQALQELLVRCDRAGVAYCAYAAGNPTKNLAALMTRLKKKPLRVDDPFSGEKVELGYADVVQAVSGSLYSDEAPDDVTYLLASVQELMNPTAGHRRSSQAARTLMAAVHRLDRVTSAGSRHGFPYDNETEAYNTVLCTDGLHPAKASSFAAAGARADRRSPYFGRFWTWASASCASDTWKARDEDAYRGSFRRRTSAPVLVIGSRWDPATNYLSAKRTAALMPNSRLLSSDNWGHTAYGTSSCVTKAMDRYLLTEALPATGTTCHGSYRPFSVPLDEDEGSGDPSARQQRTVAAASSPAAVLREQLLAAAAPVLAPRVRLR